MVKIKDIEKYIDDEMINIIFRDKLDAQATLYVPQSFQVLVMLLLFKTGIIPMNVDLLSNISSPLFILYRLIYHYLINQCKQQFPCQLSRIRKFFYNINKFFGRILFVIVFSHLTRQFIQFISTVNLFLLITIKQSPEIIFCDITLCPIFINLRNQFRKNF